MVAILEYCLFTRICVFKPLLVGLEKNLKTEEIGTRSGQGRQQKEGPPSFLARPYLFANPIKLSNIISTPPPPPETEPKQDLLWSNHIIKQLSKQLKS